MMVCITSYTHKEIDNMLFSSLSAIISIAVSDYFLLSMHDCVEQSVATNLLQTEAVYTRQGLEPCQYTLHTTVYLEVWPFHADSQYVLFSSSQHLYQTGRCLYCSLTYVWVATAGFVTEEKAMEIETSFKNNPALSAEEIVKQNCEAICLNGKWLERDSKANEEWLKTHANSIDDHR